MDRLFVVNKPIFLSSNYYLSGIKRKYKEKKAGFSGTLDPFANGCLVVAFGKYTKLFRFLKKTPKTYIATIWLGASSKSFDIENMIDIKDVEILDLENIKKELNLLVGEIEYIPPKFSAKKINGKRAYQLAREGKEVELDISKMDIFNIELINYNHPFITFKVTVSGGAYIRSLAQILCEKLDRVGTLSYLKRVNEGKFSFDNEKALNPIEYLDLEIINYSGSKEWMELGKKLDIIFFDKEEDGEYLVIFEDFFTIIGIKEKKINYILNKVYLNE